MSGAGGRSGRIPTLSIYSAEHRRNRRKQKENKLTQVRRGPPSSAARRSAASTCAATSPAKAGEETTQSSLPALLFPHPLQRGRWLRTPSGVSRRRGPGAWLCLQGEFDEAAGKSVHAPGVGDGFVADARAGAVVDLLAGILDQSQYDDQPASALQSVPHGAATPPELCRTGDA